MALSDRKIPIIAGRNNTPTTSQSEANHPNGSFFISKYNALIDNELTSLQTTVNNLAIPSTTDDLTEGTTNKYFSGKTTDNLPEGTTNKYYSDNRARLAISVTGNGSYNSSTGVINISNVSQSVDHISLTNTNGLVKTYTIWGDSGETINLGTFTVTDGTNGADGINGTNGINGIDGQDGRGIDHITSVDNGNNTKTITFWGDLAETINLGSVILASGVDGQDGANGTNGADGRGITNTSYNASNGTVTFTFSDATTFTTGDLRGANGTNGTNGTNGVDGVSPTVTVLTQAEYNALAPNYSANTCYVING